MGPLRAELAERRTMRAIRRRLPFVYFVYFVVPFRNHRRLNHEIHEAHEIVALAFASAGWLRGRLLDLRLMGGMGCALVEAFFDRALPSFS